MAFIRYYYYYNFNPSSSHYLYLYTTPFQKSNRWRRYSTGVSCYPSFVPFQIYIDLNLNQYDIHCPANDRTRMYYHVAWSNNTRGSIGDGSGSKFIARPCRLGWRGQSVHGHCYHRCTLDRRRWWDHHSKHLLQSNTRTHHNHNYSFAVVSVAW